jgi:hypothetical protein
MVMQSSIVMRRSMNVLERFLEDGVAADQRCRQPNYADPMKWLPKVKPHRRRRKRYKADTKNICNFKTVLMIMMIIFFVGIRGLGQMNTRFGDLVEIIRCILFMYDGHSRLRVFS